MTDNPISNGEKSNCCNAELKAFRSLAKDQRKCLGCQAIVTVNTPTDVLARVKELATHRPVCEEITWPNKYRPEQTLTHPWEKGDCKTVDYARHMHKAFPEIATSYIELSSEVERLRGALEDAKESVTHSFGCKIPVGKSEWECTSDCCYIKTVEIIEQALTKPL